jgi:ABC-type enterochelin transport system permease subunit
VLTAVLTDVLTAVLTDVLTRVLTAVEVATEVSVEVEVTVVLGLLYTAYAPATSMIATITTTIAVMVPEIPFLCIFMNKRYAPRCITIYNAFGAK